MEIVWEAYQSPLTIAGWKITIVFFSRKNFGILQPAMNVYLLQGPMWAPTSCKWSCNPWKWPYKWVTRVITRISGLMTLHITGRGLVECFFSAGKWRRKCARYKACVCLDERELWPNMESMRNIPSIQSVSQI